MKISSDLVGVKLPAITVTISDRQAMNFAACVGDNNPRYFDDEQEEGIIASPMLTVSLTWPLAVEHAKVLDAYGFGPVVRRQVHYTEHIIWHRPMRPGETLQIGGEVVAVMSHAAGTYGLVRFDAVDSEGRPVFVETSGAMFRGVRVDGGSKGAEAVPVLPERIERDEPLWAETLHIDPLQTYIFDGCGDLHFPIHTSRSFAHKVGLPNPIVHGTCTLSLAVRELVNRECGGDPTLLRALGCRFTGMVLPGSDISVRLTGVTEGDTRNLFFDVLNAEGKKAISEGFLAIR